MDFDGPALDALKRKAKAELRKRQRAVRAAVPRAAIGQRSLSIVGALSALDETRAARSVALFWPMEERNEVDLRAFDAGCRERGMAVFYPFIGARDGVDVGFARVDDVHAMVPSARGFLEPPEGAAVAKRGEVDLVIVPALAADPDGHRLGYGSGFYDTVLPRYCPPATAVVVAYDFQLLAELPVTEGDVACSVVVTDARVLRPRASG